LDYVQLWIDKGRPARDLPWSRSFSMRVATGEEKIAGFDPEHFNYSGDPIADARQLPKDPAMAEDMFGTLEANPRNCQATLRIRPNNERQRDPSPPAPNGEIRTRTGSVTPPRGHRPVQDILPRPPQSITGGNASSDLSLA
jgi:hypothetical protein